MLRYHELYLNSTKNLDRNIRIFQKTTIPNDSSFETTVPTVPEESILKYKEYAGRGYLGAAEPNSKDLRLYEAYVLRA